MQWQRSCCKYYFCNFTTYRKVAKSNYDIDNYKNHDIWKIFLESHIGVIPPIPGALLLFKLQMINDTSVSVAVVNVNGL